ncbi:glycosyltransferase family 2 protein [Sediminibacterium sp. TEGAF015]|uniref:glycosyltransferase family 2 protein n=1 Tax=Sediminibacterium sp. TEGAF015 TaxID=575378 RepID=UPI0021FB3C05|nr:glycosyltransferase family 2 protein [Sediminibacterium sp. TEGAF015]BDQ11261.1 glycosyl transferase family 2 [Sediminibacterium sp. TEGAF015]
MQLSIVVPLFNEEESLPELCSWIKSVVDQNGYTYEVLLIDDGSRDDSWNVIQTIANSNPNIKGIKFQRNYGKSAALNEGFKAAQGDVVITMDADMQDSPDEIPALYKMIVDDGFDMVSGWKKKRYDNTLTKNIPSKLFNAVARKSSGIQLHDFNCGLKAYKKKVVKCIEVFGEMHRYIPVLAKWSGFRKIGEKVVEHRPRKYGTTKFGWDRFINGFLDLGTIMFLGKFGKKPMQFFGLYGTLAFLIGFITSGYLMVSKILDPEVGITNKPAFYIALAVMIIGMQLFLTGFVAELVARNASERNVYLIEEKLGLEEA